MNMKIIENMNYVVHRTSALPSSHLGVAINQQDNIKMTPLHLSVIKTTLQSKNLAFQDAHRN